MKTTAGTQIQSFCGKPENRRRFHFPLIRPLQFFAGSLAALLCMPLFAQESGHLNRTIETLESGDNKPSGTATPKKNVTNGRRRVLLHWERPAPSAP
ncbi:MAG: hypothetical protein IID45_00845 [Planctomycetes bacterium]|nr:hypothetical protein [Planctomycetota bacterium]